MTDKESSKNDTERNLGRHETLRSGEIVVRHLGKYLLTGRIGIGATGEVWLGHHPELQIPIAVKVLSSQAVAQKPDYLQRFLLEAQTAAKVNHPHLVRVYDAGIDNDEYFIVMEYVEGNTLQRLLREHGALDLDFAVDLIMQIGDALKAASDHHIIHRDIKPSNIIVDKAGLIAKLSDLGFAKQLHTSSNHTQIGTSLGTPTYMAPEQAQDSRNVDLRSDIYALGATFYHMVTGHAPYPGPSAVELLEQHIRNPVPDPRLVDPTIPASIARIIMKMMAKLPESRYQTVEELQEDLRKAHDGSRSLATGLKMALRETMASFGSHLSPAQRVFIISVVVVLLLGIILAGAALLVLLLS